VSSPTYTFAARATETNVGKRVLAVTGRSIMLVPSLLNDAAVYLGDHRSGRGNAGDGART
jgi:hypothetical protein